MEATITLAVLAVESLHGESRVQLESRHAFDVDTRTCVIDASGEVGRDVNRLFLGFINREFDRDSFTVERIPAFEFGAATSVA